VAYQAKVLGPSVSTMLTPLDVVNDLVTFVVHVLVMPPAVM
jgi:hypothetical protein